MDKKTTARALISEHMNINFNLEIAEDKELSALLERKQDIQMQIRDKADSIDFFVTELSRKETMIDAEIEAYKDEIHRLRNRKRAAESTKKYLNNVLLPMIVQELGDDDGVFETDTARYKLYETYGPLIIQDINGISDDFIKTEIIQKVDKAKARKACMSLDSQGKDLPSGMTVAKVKRVKRS